MRFASEDIGNADPQALAIAVAARDAVHFIGMPEGNTAPALAKEIKRRLEDWKAIKRGRRGS